MHTLKQHLLFLLFLPLTIWWLIPAYEGTLSSMYDHSQHMEYVWMIPALSLFMLWLKRKAILGSFGKPAWGWSIPFFLLAAGLLFFGLRGGQTRFLQASAVLYLLGMSLATYGKATFREVWFPILLLAFVMPVGFLDNFTVPLRRASVSVTAVLLNGLGVEVHQSGTALYSMNPLAPFQMDVADPCSGIRSLVALFVGTAAYGAMTLRSAMGRWALFFASVPIAFFGNIIRLLLTGLICALVNQQAGMQVHDNALFIVAPVYALSVFGLADFLGRCEKQKVRLTLSPAPTAMPGWMGWTMGLLLLCALAYFRWWAIPSGQAATLESDDFLNKTFADLPEMTEAFPLFCQNRDCLWSAPFERDAPKPDVCPKCQGAVSANSKAELDILPADTQSYKVTYTRDDGIYFTVSLVIAGSSRLSIHRPELCLPSQGYSLSTREVRTLYPGMPMAFFSLTREGMYRSSGFCYVFLNASGATVSNLHRVVGDSIERSLYNRIPRWAMVTISSNIDFLTPEGEAALTDFLTQWAPTLRTK